MENDSNVEFNKPVAKVEMKQTSEKRRDLTKEEMIRITTKYGYKAKEEKITGYNPYGVPENETIYSSGAWGVFTWYWLAFSSDGIHGSVGSMSPNYVFVSWDELRNNPIFTIDFLRMLFKGFPDEIFPCFMELKELD